MVLCFSVVRASGFGGPVLGLSFLQGFGAPGLSSPRFVGHRAWRLECLQGLGA